MYLAETHIKYKDREKLKEKGYEKITMHILTKKVGISPDKIDFKIRSVARDKKKKGQFIMFKELIHHEYITIHTINISNFHA